MEGVAGAQRVDRLDFEGRQMPELAVLEPISSLRPIGQGEKAGDVFREFLESIPMVRKSGGSEQRLR